MILVNAIPIVAKYGVFLFVSWIILKLCYALLFDPLRKYPGPFLAKFTDAYHGIAALSGRTHISTYLNLQKYGPVYREGPNRLIFNTITAIEDIYSNPGVTKGSAYRQARWYDRENFFDTLDQGLHRKKRQTIGRVLSDQTLQRSFQPIISAQVNIFLKQLLRTCQDSNRPEVVNMSVQCGYLATDVMGYLAFGHDFRTQTQEAGRFYPEVMRGAIFASNFFFYWPGINFVIPMIRWFGRDKVSKFHRAVRKMILGRLKKGKDHSPDFYSMVAYDADEKTLFNSELWAESLFFLSAGSTTVATAQCGLFFNLTQHQRVYDRLAAEIRQTFTSARDIQIGPKLAGCKYLRAVIDESLRLTPPTMCALWRQPVASSTEPFIVDGNVIPSGTQVGIHLYSVLHNPEFFPEPFSFKPERWLEPKPGGDKKSDSQLAKMRRAQVTFGLGDRNCAGKSVANFETSLVIARALWYFDFERAPGAAGLVGAGKEKDASKKPWDAPDQLQMQDFLVATHDGPNLVFKPREEFWRELDLVNDEGYYYD